MPITPFGHGPKARYADSEIVLWASGAPAEIRRSAPPYGFDDDLVLRGILRYDDERIAALAESCALE